jgi:hypothetical protein
MHPLEDLALPFPDLVASGDALLTKPGYGAFAEAACCGTPVVYLERPDWPESPYLERWLGRNGRCLRLSRAEMEGGGLGAALEALWAEPGPPPVEPTGIEEAAEYLAGLLP